MLHCRNPHCPSKAKCLVQKKMNALPFICKKCQAFKGKVGTVLDQGNKKMDWLFLTLWRNNQKGLRLRLNLPSLLFRPGLDYHLLFCHSAGSGLRREWPALSISHSALASHSPWAGKQHDLNGVRMTPHTWKQVPMAFQAPSEKHQLGRPFCPVGVWFYFSNILIYFSNRKTVTLQYKLIYTKQKS